ncbi:FMN-dependent NADH-azoreductase [Geomonas azotofigens]|uniref:FMN-dependent NADH-azoreductase n=1 Tax=Geomonas azotofigens TaxID=2843196 RepID=UPI001C1271AB|nr:NAD(P)H-dependent oxidoreductase [Geomonas azotofigens]MBU5613882.1 NAD(P)H-dependent oxidoreductase [Geomonas azotofigens]
MANILYVTCNVKSQARARTLLLGDEFMDEYLRKNPQDEVQVLDLYRDSIQRVDQDVLSAWGRIERGEEYGFLSDEERRKINKIWRIADQFRRCDKYVFVTHSLNLWFPAEFKMYIDAICVLDRTYRLTPEGTEGMLHGLSRKSLHLHANQPYKFGGEGDQSVAYLRSVLCFLGVADQETVLLQGDDPERGRWDEYEAVRGKLLELARRF